MELQLVQPSAELSEIGLQWDYYNVCSGSGIQRNTYFWFRNPNAFQMKTSLVRDQSVMMWGHSSVTLACNSNGENCHHSLVVSKCCLNDTIQSLESYLNTFPGKTQAKTKMDFSLVAKHFPTDVNQKSECHVNQNSIKAISVPHLYSVNASCQISRNLQVSDSFRPMN